MTELQKLNKLVGQFIKENFDVVKESTEMQPKDLKKGEIYEWSMGAEYLEVKYIGASYDNETKDIKPGTTIGKGYFFQFLKGNNSYVEVGPNTIKKYIHRKEDLNEAVVTISTPDGTSKTSSSSQKLQALEASKKKDTVVYVKPGLAEKAEPEVEPKEDDNVEEDEPQESPNKLSNEISKHIKEAIKKLLSSSETSEDQKYKKYSNDVMKHLNKALEAFNKINMHDTKLSEEARLQDEKLGEKAFESVKKHMAKFVRRKEDIEPVMNKYSGVIKKLKDKDHAKVSEHIWKHALNEGFIK